LELLRSSLREQPLTDQLLNLSQMFLAVDCERSEVPRVFLISREPMMERRRRGTRRR